jgi:hypothetical protein
MKRKMVVSPTWQEMEILSPAEIKARIGSGMPGEIYILHFVEFDNDTGLWKTAKLAGHAGHYVGWSLNASKRIKQHECGQGACITAAAKEAGFSWIVTDIIPGDRYLERYMKNSKNTKQYCHICTGGAAKRRVDRIRDEYANALVGTSVKEA